MPSMTRRRHHEYPFHTLAVVVLLAALPAPARQQPSPAKTIPDSIDYMWKMVERDFTSLADVRTFAEQVKHVACANEAWAKKLRGETPPDPCDTGGPSPANCSLILWLPIWVK
jgi:hypothetical protein